MHLNEGKLLYQGKYQIVRFISAGDFGYTYEAICARDDRREAIKELFLRDCCERNQYNDEVSATSLEKVELFNKMKRRFAQEATSLMQFDHPNIVRVTDVFFDNGTAYYAMDFVNGITLKQLLEQKGRLAEREALSYMDQLCDAIGYVHSKNRLHLDIRPANVIISPNGHVNLVDFGFSKRLDPADHDPNVAGMIISTNSYSPTELNVDSDATITPASDIYSLGATLYTLLTGMVPPDAALLVQYPLSELPSNISPNVAEAIRRAMSPNKAQRPQNVEDFRRMLHTQLDLGAQASGVNPYTSGDDGADFYNNPNQMNMQSSTYNNSYSSSNRNLEDQNYRYDDEPEVVTPSQHDGSEMSQIDFGFDNIRTGDGEGVQVDPPYNDTGVGYTTTPYNRGGNNGANGQGGGNTTTYTNTGTIFGPNTGGTRTGTGYTGTGHTGGGTGGGGSTGANWGLIVGVIFALLFIGGAGYWAYNQFFSSATSFPQGSSAVVEGVPGTSLGSFADNDPEMMGELGGHYWVDLGLPSGTKWATTNIGASAPTDFGGYYAWGETQTKNVYNYENSATYEKPMGEIGGNATFDPASKQWGQSWRLPTKDEFEELLQNCSYRWVEIDGVKGGLFKSRNNGQSIFLPAAGFRYGVITSDTDASYVGIEGTYWTDTPVPNDKLQENAYGLRLYGNSIQKIEDKFHRGAGRSIRPVAK